MGQMTEMSQRKYNLKSVLLYKQVLFNSTLLSQSGIDKGKHDRFHSLCNLNGFYSTTVARAKKTKTFLL